jgi:hypothetical protein
VKDVDISRAGGWIEVACHRPPSRRGRDQYAPGQVFANGPECELEQLRGDLHGRWRQATRAVMVLLSLHGLPPAQIAALLDCHPATVRRWISRFNDEGAAGLADRPRCGRPWLGGQRLTSRIAALLGHPGPWTLPRVQRYVGRPQVSMRTLYRRGSIPTPGSPRASVIRSTSVPMSLPIRLHTCLRSLTRSPRFHVLPEPEPPSGGRPESSPAVRERRLPSRARSGMTVRWPDVRLHARAGSEGPRLLSAASTCRLSPVSRPRTQARARNPRPQRTAGQPAPRIPLPPGGSPADHALAGGQAVTRAPVGHPRLLHMASTRPGGSTASLSCASG